MKSLTVPILLIAVTLAPVVRADDRADMDQTKIIGNRELPKVLYIVPWKKPDPTELNGRPMKSVLDEALAPIDREVFRRQVRYETQVQEQAAAAAGAAPSAPHEGRQQ